MDWLPNSDVGIALLVGIMGGLVGALLGFASNYINTSRQIDRQERDVRRSVYGEYLAVALELERFRGDQVDAHLLARSSQNTLDGHRQEAAQVEDAETRHEIEKAIDYIEPQTKAFWAEFEAISQEFSKHFRTFVSMSHRLKIVAPPLIHEVAMQAYNDLRSMDFVFNDEVRRHAADHFNKTLVLFTELARSDTKAPGAKSWSELHRVYEPIFREHAMAEQAAEAG